MVISLHHFRALCIYGFFSLALIHISTTFKFSFIKWYFLQYARRGYGWISKSPTLLLVIIWYLWRIHSFWKCVMSLESFLHMQLWNICSWIVWDSCYYLSSQSKPKIGFFGSCDKHSFVSISRHRICCKMLGRCQCLGYWWYPQAVWYLLHIFRSIVVCDVKF